MSFYTSQQFPNRKDHRKPGHDFPECNPGGGCWWCRHRRDYRDRKRRESAAEQMREFETDPLPAAGDGSAPRRVAMCPLSPGRDF